MPYNKYKTIFIPSMDGVILDDGILYMIPHYNCAIHNCMCGCKEKVVTPLNDCNDNTRHHWDWSFDGKNVSLTPSVGNFHQQCKSHYYLKNGKVHWC